MAHQVPNTFTTYKLTDAEQLQGYVLSGVQKMVIQNELSRIANQVLTLKFDPQNQMSFVQEDAYLKGQLAVFQTLLLQSEEAEQQLRNQA